MKSGSFILPRYVIKSSAGKHAQCARAFIATVVNLRLQRSSPQYVDSSPANPVIMKATVLILLQLLANALVDAQISAPDTVAPYCVGLEVDGAADEWESCGASETTLDMMQVEVAGAGNDRLQGALRVRFANDGTNIYVLAQVNAPYYFNLTGANELSHSFAVMWRVGESATMFNMGGCTIPGVVDQYNCSAVQSMCTSNPSQCDCADYLTDVWHMETSSPGALPGVQYPYRGPVLFTNSDGTYSSYGYNPQMLGMYQPAVERLFSGNDHTSNSDDEFSVHPCIRDDDASSKAHLSRYLQRNMYTYRNQLRYAWSHSAINSYQYPFATNGADGTYIFEFSRPLTTNENTDAQFSVGGDGYYSFALWIPPALGGEWIAAGHYVAPADLISFGKVTLQQQSNAGSSIKSVLSLLILGVLISMLHICF